MKRIVFLFAAVIMLSLLMTGCNKNSEGSSDTTADTAILEANPASDFEYEISESGDAVYISKYTGQSENVVVPSKIEEIPVKSLKGFLDDNGNRHGAFEANNIKTVIIPESVTAIGINAFKDCKELNTITVTNNLEKISDGAFRNCEKLQSIDFSHTSVTSLGQDAFSGCINLKEIMLPDCLELIQKGAFYGCNSLTELDLPESLETLEEGAIVNCATLSKINIPNNLSLECIEIPSVSEVPSLKEIVFEEGREDIIGYAFFDITSDIEIKIPSSVKRFSTLPFFIHKNAKFVFLCDFPEIIDSNEFYGNPTICYDPDTKGWDNCVWKDFYPMNPIE